MTLDATKKRQRRRLVHKVREVEDAKVAEYGAGAFADDSYKWCIFGVSFGF